MRKWITENADYKCKRSIRGCTWKGSINDYYREVSQRFITYFLSLKLIPNGLF